MDPLCPLCKVEAETTRHVLWGCPATKNAWSMCNSKIRKKCIEHDEFVYIVEDLHKKLKHEDFEFLTVVARNMWLQHNRVIHGGPFSHLTILVSKAPNSSPAFISANTWQYTREEVGNQRNLRWQAPIDGFVKVN